MGAVLTGLADQPVASQRTLLRQTISPLVKFAPRSPQGYAAIAPVLGAAYAHWLAALDALWTRALQHQGSYWF